nr:MAG TPA: hypothetical protein [Caudoviricetes sp.]
MYYKQVENGIILSIGILEVANDSVTEITETEYNNLLAIMKKAPKDGAEYGYHLSAETLQYEFYVKPREEAVDWYVGKILNEEMTIDDVPETYREEVKAKLPVPPEQTYTLDEAATIIAQEVSAE